MTWTIERCEEDVETSKEGIMWMDLDENSFFILQQKLRDTGVQTKTVIETKDLSNEIPKPSELLVVGEGLRFQFFLSHEREVIQEKAQFRIVTKKSMTINSQFVIAIGFEHEIIQKHWETLTNIVKPLFRQVGLDTNFSTIKFNSHNWTQFLLLQIVHLVNTENSVEATPKRLKKAKNRNRKVSTESAKRREKRKKKRQNNKLKQSIDSMDSTSSSSPKIQRSISDRLIAPVLLIPTKSDDNEQFNEQPLTARERNVDDENEKAIIPLLELQKSEVHKDEIKECFKSFDLSDDKLLQARSCFIIFINNTNHKKLFLGVLFLSKGGHLCFYSKKTSSRLSIPFYNIERVHINQYEYPNNLTIVTSQQEEFLFAGVGNIRQFTNSWSNLFNRRIKLIHRLIHQQTLRKKEQENASSSGRRLRIFAQRIAAKLKKTIEFKSTEPLFDVFDDLHGCNSTNSNGNEINLNCVLLTPPIHSSLVNGKLHIGLEDFCFISDQDLVFTAPYHHIVSMEGSDMGKTKEILISLARLNFPILLQDVSHEACALLISRYNEIQNQIFDKRELSYRSIFYSQELTNLQNLKQEYIEQNVIPTSDYIMGLWKLYFSCHDKLCFRTDLLLRLIYIGIPNALRGDLWCSIIGITEKRASSCEVSYGCMLQHYKNKNSTAIQEIKRDIHRSLPQHPFFQNECGMKSLENVLCMYSWRNDCIGYCQSMNLVCAMLLLYLSEENTYFMLSTICGKYL